MNKHSSSIICLRKLFCFDILLVFAFEVSKFLSISKLTGISVYPHLPTYLKTHFFCVSICLFILLFCFCVSLSVYSSFLFLCLYLSVYSSFLFLCLYLSVYPSFLVSAFNLQSPYFSCLSQRGVPLKHQLLLHRVKKTLSFKKHRQ
jgi:hypothetical protein